MVLAIASITETSINVDQTSHLIAMPASVAANDLLLCFTSFDGNATITTPSGWSIVYSAPQSSNLRGGLYAKVANGTEGGTTVDFVTALVEQCAAQVYHITGSVEVISVDIGTPTSLANTGVNTIDPPPVTASWGAKDNLFITALATSSAATLISGPSGWGTPTKTNEGAGGNAGQVYTSVLTGAVATGDPGIWTVSANGVVSVHCTVVVRPKIGSVGVPVNTVAGVQTSANNVAISIPVVASGRILVVKAHARRASTTLAPDDPTLVDSSAAPLTWTPVFAVPPSQVGLNPGTKAQWWWARADGAAKTVTATFLNAAIIFSSVEDFSIGAGLTPNFSNQAYASSTGTPSGAVTATLPTVPVAGVNSLSFYGGGGSVSVIPTGWITVASVAATPYRTGYSLTMADNVAMGAGFVDQILAFVNITDAVVVTTLNPADKKNSNVSLSNGNLTVTGFDASNNWVRSTTARTGKRYVEFTSTTVANTVFGISDLSAMTFPGADAKSFGLFYHGFGSINGTFPDWLTPYASGNVVGMAVDLTAKLVWWRVGAGNWNGSGTANPATGVGGFSISLYTGTPHYVVVSGDLNCVTTVNFGASALANAAPSGFDTWDIPAAPGTGLIKVWTGSAWVAKPVKVWTGSAWVTKPLKRWNGSAWV